MSGHPATNLGCEMGKHRGLQRTMDDKAGITLDLVCIVRVVVNPVAVEGQRRITEEQRRCRLCPSSWFLGQLAA